jgi:hypothetical protein
MAFAGAMMSGVCKGVSNHIRSHQCGLIEENQRENHVQYRTYVP